MFHWKLRKKIVGMAFAAKNTGAGAPAPGVPKIIFRVASFGMPGPGGAQKSRPEGLREPTRGGVGRGKWKDEVIAYARAHP